MGARLRKIQLVVYRGNQGSAREIAQNKGGKMSKYLILNCWLPTRLSARCENSSIIPQNNCLQIINSESEKTKAGV